MRAEPADVDLTQRVWRPRDGKGGWGPGIYLNDDMMAAWELFVEADAWGFFGQDRSFAPSDEQGGRRVSDRTTFVTPWVSVSRRQGVTWPTSRPTWGTSTSARHASTTCQS